jgi:hypothetical protein
MYLIYSRNIQNFIETVGLVPCSHKSATGPYSEPCEFNSQTQTFLEEPFLYYSAIQTFILFISGLPSKLVSPYLPSQFNPLLFGPSKHYFIRS